MKPIDFPEEDLQKFKEKTKRVWYTLAGQLYPQQLLDSILKDLEEFRKQKRYETTD